MIEPTTPPPTGARELTWAPVTTRASGETLRLAIHTLRGAADGPTLGLFSTSHGDEAFTVQVIRAVLERIDPARLRGTIRALPVGNPVAFESYTRSTGQGMNTDKTNLNRVFPGNPRGWLTEQIAHVISTSFVEGLDALIDFHCGNTETAIDYILLEHDDSAVGRASAELSRLCGTDLLYTAPTPEQGGTLSQYAKSKGIPAVIAQLGGNVPDPKAYVERCFVGVRNVLVHLGMLEGEIVLPPKQTMLSGPRTLLAPHHGGLFLPEVGFDMLGKTVPKGTVLGRVISPHTFEELEVLRAVYDETILIMLRGVMSRVNPGDYAYILCNGAVAETLRNPPREARVKPDPSPSPTDLSVEQVRLLLAQQGYVIPEIELIEVTASVNALIEGLTHMEAYGTLENEPWPTLVGYVEMPSGATSPSGAGASGAGGTDRAR